MKKVFLALLLFSTSAFGQIGICSVDTVKYSEVARPITSAEYDFHVDMSREVCQVDVTDWPSPCAEDEMLVTDSMGALICAVQPTGLTDGDKGDFSCTTGVCTLDDDVVGVAEMADADHGDFTYTTGVATLDNDVVSAAEMADADHGDVAWSSGVATVQAVTTDAIAEIADIASALKSGVDATLITGTEGTDGNCAQWNVDGDLVDSGGACGGSSPGFDDIASGTNTTAAMVVGAGSTLKVTSTGTIDASGLDYDGDGVLEISSNGSLIGIDTNDNGNDEYEFTSTHIARSSAEAGHFILQSSSNNQDIAFSIGALGVLYDFGKNYAIFSKGIGLSSAVIEFTATELDVFKIIDYAHQSTTCTDSGDGNPGFVIITATNGLVNFTNSDADGCDVSVSETGAQEGMVFKIRVISTAGGTVNFADSAGAQELPATCSLNLYGIIQFSYLSDRWAQEFCTTF